MQGIVPDGFQEVLSQLADACQQLGYAILVQAPHTLTNAFTGPWRPSRSAGSPLHLKQHYPRPLQGH